VTSNPPAEVRRDFDRIATALEAAGGDDTLQPYERALLALLPPACGYALEVGCGDGALTRQVARRAHQVLAVDLSPEMIRLARVRSVGQPNIEYRVADFMTTDLPQAAFDLVLSVATVHHLPLSTAVKRLAAAVRPGGSLVIQDLVERAGIRYVPVNGLAWLVRCLRRALSRTQRPDRALEALYREHGRGERYLTPHQVRSAYAELLPGARVVHHLEWRYTVIWKREAAP
jgi:SAM-dependent methyltransferase